MASEKEIEPGDQNRFFLRNEDIIQLKECKVAISSKWNQQSQVKNIIDQGDTK